MIKGITGKAYFSCSKCGEEYELDIDDLEFHPESGTMRSMGEETQYLADFEQQCDSCNQNLHIQFEVWEYPIGAINHASHSSSGVLNVKYDVAFSYSNEDENNRIVGAAAGGAILGASLGGPVGAIIGGVVGLFLGDSVNKSKNDGGKNG